jgi:hypothetical protein
MAYCTGPLSRVASMSVKRFAIAPPSQLRYPLFHPANYRNGMLLIPRTDVQRVGMNPILLQSQLHAVYELINLLHSRETIDFEHCGSFRAPSRPYSPKRLGNASSPFAWDRCFASPPVAKACDAGGHGPDIEARSTILLRIKG